MKRIFTFSLLAAGALAGTASPAHAQRGGNVNQDSLRAHRWEVEKELESVAIVERKVMIPMRDGKRHAGRHLSSQGYVQEISRHLGPHALQLQLLGHRSWRPRDMSAALTAVKRGYAYIEMQERGHFFAEGNYDILGPPRRTAKMRSTG